MAQLEVLRMRLDTERLDIDDTLELRSEAETLRAFAQASQLGLRLANEAVELKIRAERRAGALLYTMMVDAPHTRRRDGMVRTRRALPNGVLRQVGISNTHASEWTAMSQLPEQEFEQRLAAVKQAGRQLTSVAFVRAAHRFLRQPGKGGVQPGLALRRLQHALQDLRDVHKLSRPLEVAAARKLSFVVDDLLDSADEHQEHVAPEQPRATSCLLCGRPAPSSRPPKCPTCGGSWLTA